jgi:hypothetical protein
LILPTTNDQRPTAVLVQPFHVRRPWELPSFSGISATSASVVSINDAIRAGIGGCGVRAAGLDSVHELHGPLALLIQQLDDFLRQLQKPGEVRFIDGLFA